MKNIRRLASLYGKRSKESMSQNYRTHLEDKMAHTLRTTLWQLYAAPSVQAPLKAIEYRTRSTERNSVTYALTGYGKEIRFEVFAGTLMESLVAALKANPTEANLDRFHALMTTEATK